MAGTSLLEPLKTVDQEPDWKPSDDQDDRPVILREELDREKMRAGFLKSAIIFSPDEAGNPSAEGEPSLIKFKWPRDESPGRSGQLRASLHALGQVRSSTDPADWLEAAGTLKRDALRLRRTSYARHSSVLLALADALTFTEPDDPTLGPDHAAAVDRGLALLVEPFVAEPQEEEFLVGMIEAGWNLAPSATTDPLSL